MTLKIKNQRGVKRSSSESVLFSLREVDPPPLEVDPSLEEEASLSKEEEKGRYWFHLLEEEEVSLPLEEEEDRAAMASLTTSSALLTKALSTRMSMARVGTPIRPTTISMMRALTSSNSAKK